MFEYKENFLTPEIIAVFDKYCELSESDKSSDDAWNPRFKIGRASCRERV